MVSSGFSSTVTQHTAHESMDSVIATLPCRNILSSADIIWPERSPELFTPRYFSLETLSIQSICKQISNAWRVEKAQKEWNQESLVYCKQLYLILRHEYQTVLHARKIPIWRHIRLDTHARSRTHARTRTYIRTPLIRINWEGDPSG